MGFNVEKLAAMAKPCSEESLKQARFRKENREWLRISQEIALALHYYLRKQNMGSPAKTCVYPKIMDRRNRKKFTSMTPLS
jgi:hypothetical protein